jgi:hypothetical protein
MHRTEPAEVIFAIISYGSLDTPREDHFGRLSTVHAGHSTTGIRNDIANKKSAKKTIGGLALFERQTI